VDFHKDPRKPLFRVRYIGWVRPGWFQKKKPTWVVEAYVEGYPPMPEMDSTWYYREQSRWHSHGEAVYELLRFLGPLHTPLKP
jgi:hypothetical protein